MDHQYTIFALGDSAATIELGKIISETLNEKVLAMQKWFEENQFAGLKDIIAAYSSLTLIYDPFIVAKKNSIQESTYQWVQAKLRKAYLEASVYDDRARYLHHIPVCYDEEFGIDLQHISKAKDLSMEQIIELHVSQVYRVYMLGFLPGFAYLGELSLKLEMPRKENPVYVNAGSIGIVSNQTGIYSVSSPGGWQIIGRTPVPMFNARADTPVKMKAGETVQFYRITHEEYMMETRNK